MWLTELADVLRGAGLTVVEEPGWKTRGAHGQQMLGVNTITCHHTAGPPTGDLPSLAVVRDGRPGLAGPLSQLALARSGVWHVIAAGLANHVGDAAPGRTNSYSIGVEAEATGTDPWPEAQMASYARGVRALRDRWRAQVWGHKEVALPLGRKVDPNFDMNAFRARVGAVKPGTPAGVPPSGSNDGGPAGPFPWPVTHLFGPNSTPPNPTWHDGRYSYGKIDEKWGVLQIQREVGAAGDGVYGQETVLRVAAWQKLVNGNTPGLSPKLRTDGMVDAATWDVMTRR